MTAQEQDDWLAVSAAEKARSVTLLTADLDISRVLEVGAGSGSILEQLDSWSFADEYYACEPSRELHDKLRQKRIPRLRDTSPEALEHSPYAHSEFDLVIIAHVLEHVIDPAALLNQALKLAPYVVFEVPIEQTPSGRLSAWVRTRISGRPRVVNAPGHINFFSPARARLMTELAGGDVAGERAYFPSAVYEHLAERTSNRWLRLYRKLLVRLSVMPHFVELYSGHMAVLAKRREISPEWRHSTYAPPEFVVGAPARTAAELSTESPDTRA